VYLNRFAPGLDPVDMTGTDEFESLLVSADDLGIDHPADVRYLSRQTVINGIRLHFLEWGHPGSPVIILLHGGNQSAHSWDLVSLSLSDRFHIFALDQRGHGDSEWARDLDYSVDARARDVVAFIDSEELSVSTIIGHSMGGLVTLTCALWGMPAELRLVLVDTGPELSQKGVDVVHNFVSSSVEFDDLEEFLDLVAQYDRFRSREHISRTLRYNVLQRADGRYVSKADKRRLLAPSTAKSELADYANLQNPVLVVRGAESEVLEEEAAERFVAALPKAQLATVPGTGHNVHSGNTPGFLHAVAPFLT
jgi:pimeloyl-ACP methyl ester carboxylesterase